MEEKTFKKSIKNFNIEYKKIFGYIPCIENYSCTQNEYRRALRRAIQDKRDLSESLIAYTKETVKRTSDINFI